MLYDILKQQKKSLTIKISSSEISGIKNNNITKSGCRIFKNGKILSSAHVGSIKDEELIEKANEKKNVGINYEYNLSQPKVFSYVSEEENPTDKNIILQLNDILGRARSDFPDLVWSGEYELSNESNVFVSSQGHHLSSSGSSSDWYLVYKKKGSKNMMDGFLSHKGVQSSFLETYCVYSDFIKNLDKIEKPKSNRLPVMFIQMDEQIQWKISDDVSADKFETGSSLLSGKLGISIFNKELDIYDINFQPEYAIYSRFDGEGILRENLPVFKNGVFHNPLYDLRTAQKYQKTTTGNGFRNYNTGVSVRHFNLVFNRGKESWKNFARKLDECIVVFVAAGGACDDNWNYSSPVQISYLLRRGEIVGQCPQLTIKANLKEIFGSRFLGVSKDSFVGDELHPCMFSEMDILLH